MNAALNENINLEEIKHSLVNQAAGRARWRETTSHMAENCISRIAEIGSNKMLNGMLKIEQHNFELANVVNIPESEEFLKSTA